MTKDELAKELDVLIGNAPDCLDHSCHYSITNAGVRTNGGCKCLNEMDGPKRLFFRKLFKLAKEMRVLL